VIAIIQRDRWHYIIRRFGPWEDHLPGEPIAAKPTDPFGSPHSGEASPSQEGAAGAKPDRVTGPMATMADAILVRALRRGQIR